MTVDSKNPANSDKMMSLSDGLIRYEFDIVGDPPDINEEPQVPTSHIFGKAGKEFGDWEPGHSHIQQKTWVGGRASQEFFDDESKFMDSRSLWNFTPEHLHPAPQWRFAGPLDVFSENYMPASGSETIGNNVRWIRLVGSTSYSRKFTAGSSVTHVLGQLWVRKHGTPGGNLTFELWSDDGVGDGKPSSQIETATLDESSFEADISSVGEWTMSQALTSGTAYHVVVYDSAAADDQNYFEVAYSTGGDANLYNNSTDARSTWNAESDIQLCFRISEARWAGRWFQFNMEGARYAVSSRDDDTNSLLYINGDRGIATSGSTTTIVDTTKSWTVDEWKGVRVRCTKGTGVGQFSEIASNTSDTVTLSTTQGIAFDSTSEYVFYATDTWTAVVPATVDLTDRVVSQPIVFDNMVLFPYGSATNMLRVRWNSGTPGHEGNAEATKADFLTNATTPTEGAVVVRAENDTVDLSTAPVAVWATDLSFGTEVRAGESTDLITGLNEFEGAVTVRKESEIGVFRNNNYRKMAIGLDTMAQATNGIAAAPWNLMLYVNWAYSVEQIMGNNVDDVGPWLNAGLPAGRRGTVSAMEPTQAIMYFAIDAGPDRTSSVLGWNRIGYGSVFEAWISGRRVRGVEYQSCPGTQDRLWIHVENELIVMELPDESLNMLTDSGMFYQHESVFESGTVNMNAARIVKLFNSLALTTRNLQNRVTMLAYYQVDDDIDDTTWYDIGEFNRSDYQERGIWQGNRHRIRIRLIFRTGVAATPAVLRAWVIEAYGRIPVKYQWTLRIPVRSLIITDNKVNADPDKFVAWLKQQSQSAGSLVMGSIWPDLDNTRVLVEPPSVIRHAIQRMTKAKVLTISIAIRES